jgi:hypothetical protein
MKFIEHSPEIPSELIRDVNDGNIVFLCGAGVSRGVGLPLFQELTDDVYARLGESQANEAAERIAYGRTEYDRVLRSLEKRTLLPGTDSRVRAAVAEILVTPDDVDLSRHLSLLHLSRDRVGRPRLLTTNFDTLFERAALQASITVTSHAGKSIPRPGDPRDHGILHLHGRLADDTLKLELSDLILTSADLETRILGTAGRRNMWKIECGSTPSSSLDMRPKTRLCACCWRHLTLTVIGSVTSRTYTQSKNARTTLPRFGRRKALSPLSFLTTTPFMTRSQNGRTT